MMKKKSLISLLIILCSYICLKLENEHPEILLISKMKNNLTPFVLKSEDQFDIDNEYFLFTTCTEKIKQKLTFNIITNLICEENTLNFNLEQLNYFLENLNVDVLSGISKQGFEINYTLTFRNSKKELKKIPFQQKLRLIQEIPIILKLQEFEYLKGKSFSEEVLEVHPNFMSKKISFLFEFRNSNNKLPHWLNYKFQKDKLIVFGKFPNEDTEAFNFRFIIYEKTTRFSSKEITLNIIGKEKFNTFIIHNYILIPVLTFVFIIVCFITIFCLLKKKRTSTDKRKEFEESMERNIKANVLSNSQSSDNSDRFYLTNNNNKDREKVYLDTEPQILIDNKEINDKEKETIEVKFRNNFMKSSFNFKSADNKSFSDIINDSKANSYFEENNPFK